MLRLLRELALPAATLAAPFIVQSAPTSAPEATERTTYDFVAESQLNDFEPLAGSWSIAAGTLWCTSKGTHEELRWRRLLSPRGVVTLKLAGPGQVALRVKSASHAALLRVDHGGGRFFVEADDKIVLERKFEPPTSGPLALSLTWAPASLEVRVGDDEPVRAELPGIGEPFETLTLLSLRSQPRFDDLAIARIGTPKSVPPPADGSPPLTENQRVAVERATALLDGGGDAAGALDLLERELPPAKEGVPPRLPTAILRLLQRVALHDYEKGNEKSHAREPLKSLIATRLVVAKDGSASFCLPLDGVTSGFTAQAADIRRADGPVFVITNAANRAGPESALTIEVYRYDGKLKYWFGRDPRIVYCSGGGGPTLARARADEQKELVPKTTLKLDVARSKSPLGGETSYVYELARPVADHPERTRALREVFALHRGDTWRITVEGPQLALELSADDVAWILATFRFGE